jgi:hypothetical protein
LKFVRTAKTYVLCRRNLEFETSKWQLLVKFPLHRLSSTHLAQTFNQIVWQHMYCRNDYLWHQPCPQWIFLDDALQYRKSAECE